MLGKCNGSMIFSMHVFFIRHEPHLITFIIAENFGVVALILAGWDLWGVACQKPCVHLNHPLFELRLIILLKREYKW